MGGSQYCQLHRSGDQPTDTVTGRGCGIFQLRVRFRVDWCPMV